MSAFFSRPPFPVVDCDGHLDEMAILDWGERLPKQYHDLAPRWVTVGNKKVGFIEGKLNELRKEDVLGTGPTLTPIKRHPEWISREGEKDPQKRIPDMDYMGIDVSVIFGSRITINGIVMVEDPGLALAISQAYNDWVAKEFCAPYPDRLKAMACIPLQDGKAAAQEVKRAKKLGLVGAHIPGHFRLKPLHHPDFDVLWAACEEADMPVCVHGFNYMTDGHEMMDRYFTKHIFSNSHSIIEACTFFCAYGILARFPKLRVGFFEGSAGWAPWLADRFDEHWNVCPTQLPWQKVSPAEDMRSNQVFYSAQVSERSLPSVLKYIGEDLVGFNSDYSHWDSECPESVKKTWEREDLTFEQKRKVLGANAARFFKISVRAPVVA